MADRSARDSNPTGSRAEPSTAPGPVTAVATDAPDAPGTPGSSRSGQDRSPSVRDTNAAHKRRSSGRRRLTVGQRREELIDAALELFGERSPEDVSIDDVAARAGASRALVYHYFGGKHELYVAALRSAADRLSVLLDPPTEGRPLDRMRISLSHYFDFVEDHAAGFSALLRGGPADRSGEVGEIIEGIRQLLLGRILQAIGADTTPAVLRLTLRSWLASVEAAGIDWLERKDLARDKLETLLIEQFVALMQIAARHDPLITKAFENMRSAETARQGATAAAAVPQDERA